MELHGEEAEKLIKHINAMMESGFGITNRTVEAIGCIMKNRVASRANATWGIKPKQNLDRLREINKARPPDNQYKAEYDIVANASFFHPDYMVASGLTYEEAEAIVKLLGE